ncbi:ATP-binding protein [Spirillospora sp. NPDC029432]|uniref:ATP-binding protein n=1 Tax=Spirillospora sp. NPDC029432 TaxID=3154599 RepID=UPI003452A90F
MSGNSGIADEMDMTCLAAWTVAGQVRAVIGLRLAGWGLERLVPDAVLVAGELVANAVRSTPEREIRVRFVRENGAVLFGVWDSSDEMPVAAPVKELEPDDVGPDARALDVGYDDGTGGWGLPIVQALSAECGVCPTRPGKWVWARLKV